ncbi:MAG: DUF4965 domain-containing protein [Planctomycetota bacterium]
MTEKLRTIRFVHGHLACLALFLGSASLTDCQGAGWADGKQGNPPGGAVRTPPERRMAEGNDLIPPATPLVVCDPYFSIWSPTDALYESDTVHWTGRPHRLASLARIDGKAYRLMGADPERLPALEQKGLQVLPTRTIYEFAGAGIALTLSFMNAALPEDLDLLSRPVTYLTWDVRATDGKEHDLSLFFGASSELTVNTVQQEVVWERTKLGELSVMRIGSKDQPILVARGDDVRIDWGHLYIAAPSEAVDSAFFADQRQMLQGFVENGLEEYAIPAPESPARAAQVSAGLVMKLGRVGAAPRSRWLLLAYDDLYSIQYMERNLRPYWRRNGWGANDLIAAAAKERESLRQRCEAFDGELMADLERLGGEKYAKLSALAYRQCFAASKFVADENGQPLSFCKECFSNGCIGTSDVFYPMAPQFLLFGPSVAKSFLVPFMNYANSPRWKFPFAPHDLGTYPHANGQCYGGGEQSEENQMPVEESGNLLILMAAIARMEGHADFAGLYWPLLGRWAEYLKEKGFDPENQLCTDDFAGHLAHNVNLSAKAICGLASFAMLCEMRGEKERAEEYRTTAKRFVARWLKEADDGDHYRLAFDLPGSWSQKYNLVWDRILGFHLWPAFALQREMEQYKKIQGRYGLPLDNRSLYTKLDWTLWTATLTGDSADFQALLDPVFRFLNETPERVPMTDWYWTHDGHMVGFRARPVVGGVFLRALYDEALWRKYAERDATRAKNWAPLPKPPKRITLTPTAGKEEVRWRYTTLEPPESWTEADFDDAAWKTGAAGFGTPGTPGSIVGTVWDTSDIWLRREFDMPDHGFENVQLRIHHDEDAEVYLNGVQILAVRGYTTSYETMPVSPAVLKEVQPGRNVLSVHCRQTIGGQYIDVGLCEVIPVK